MRLIEAQQKLKALKVPVLQTSDAAGCLKITRAHASQILVRLAKANIVFSIARGLWAFNEIVDPLLLPEHLTAPFPAYVSLQTALYYHGMISQIPAVVYGVSLARTRQYPTPIGDISIHHIEPPFFFGFEIVGTTNIKMACPEKALLDILYLSPARSLLFRALPELELGSKFNIPKALKMIDKIPSQRLKTLITKKLERCIDEKI
jgi:predicted transcriptional regulator of viral defense system